MPLFIVATLAATILSILGLLGLSNQGLSATSGVTALLIGSLVGIMATISSRKYYERPTFNFWDIAALSIWSLASLRAFLWLIFQASGQLKIISPYNLGDLSLHIHIIQYLASGTPFWPESPILAGTPLKYPIGMDLFNSILVNLGMPLNNSLIIVGVVCSLLCGWTLWKWGGAFTLIATLLGGGLTGFAIFQQHELLDWQGKAEWKNIFLTMIVTQRGLLFAIPAGTLLLTQWRRRIEERKGITDWWVEVLLYSTMPIFSMHTFIFLSLLLLIAFIFDSSNRIKWLAFVSISAPIAATLVACITGGSNPVHIAVGWTQSGNPLLFWIMNFGLMIPLMAITCYLAIKSKKTDAIVFAGTSIIMFVACCFISFAVWPWDNTKLMIWSWIAILPFIWEYAIKPLPKIIAFIIIFVLCFTGAISLYAGLHFRHNYGLISILELADAKNISTGVPRDARIIAAPTFNHPLGLIGRSLIVGYDGHLWSHGLNFRENYNTVEAILRGDPNWKKKAAQLGARYLFWGRREQEKYPKSTKPWEKEATCIAEGESAKLYRLW